MMATRSLLCLFVFVAGFVNVRSDETTCTCEKMMTIDAAYSYYDADNAFHLRFISGDNVHRFKNFQADGIVSTQDFSFPQDAKIQAVFTPAKQADGRAARRIVYGKDAIYYMRNFYKVPPVPIRVTKVRYGKKRAFIEHGGPDAAAYFNGADFVFKGCHVAIRRRWNDWVGPSNISDAFPGVPCHVDAAWENLAMGGGILYILKGRQYWEINANTLDLTGPTPLASHVTFEDNWVVKPAKDEIVG